MDGVSAAAREFLAKEFSHLAEFGSELGENGALLASHAERLLGHAAEAQGYVARGLDPGPRLELVESAAKDLRAMASATARAKFSGYLQAVLQRGVQFLGSAALGVVRKVLL